MPYQSASELRAELKRLKRDTDSDKLLSAESHPAHGAHQSPKAKRPLALSVAAALFLLLAASVWVLTPSARFV